VKNFVDFNSFKEYYVNYQHDGRVIKKSISLEMMK